MRVPRCPHCPYSSVKPTRLSWLNWPWRLFLRREYHCRSCQSSFIGRHYPFERFFNRVAIWRWLM